MSDNLIRNATAILEAPGMTATTACYRYLFEMEAIPDMGLALRTPADIGALIRARRKALGWDQATLAEKVGVSRLWVNQIEAGKPGASLSLVLKTFGVLDLTLEARDPGPEPAQNQRPAASIDIDAIVRAARGKRDA